MADSKEATKPKTEVAKAQSHTPKLERRSSMPMFGFGDGHPLTMMRRFAEEMDRLFDDFGVRVPSFMGRGRERPWSDAGSILAEWSPRIDVLEQNGQFMVRADLPGLSKDDVQIEMTDNSVTIRGERKLERTEHREGYTYTERGYGSFFREIPFPEGVDASKAKAEFRNGVLEIAMPAPQQPETKARRLEIQEKK
jgi:HSP20 family protein